MYDYLASDKLHKLQYITVFTSYPSITLPFFTLLPFCYLTFLIWPSYCTPTYHLYRLLPCILSPFLMSLPFCYLTFPIWPSYCVPQRTFCNQYRLLTLHSLTLSWYLILVSDFPCHISAYFALPPVTLPFLNYVNIPILALYFNTCSYITLQEQENFNAVGMLSFTENDFCRMSAIRVQVGTIPKMMYKFMISVYVMNVSLSQFLIFINLQNMRETNLAT